ncbi:MarR family winged helix-turn-helix transcriptional regulator [Rhodohalobacter sulfatireducens]|uniref:MarR family transcriptional regulator n=1 Tax=Rhodohalobacter sulfatireducens TaxID=2911366 RepID=A0ABS9KHH6_9BACT|nr:MarR family transcriptional regulator [Rhodohalobacter sulfatireducens]MCG2590285.1 MarR family transcriptional regulator [Rhodohalobacter sulfatireducens]
MHSAANLFSREITRHFDSYFEEYDLATSYVELLLILYDQDELSQNDLAEEMKLAPSTITRFVNKLVKKGLIQKKKVGRTAVITLSKKGEDELPTLKRAFDNAVSDLEAILGNKFVHTTKGLLIHGTALLKQK